MLNGPCDSPQNISSLYVSTSEHFRLFSLYFINCKLVLVGVFAVGHFALGIFSAGIFSLGSFSMGILSLGLLALGVFVVAWKAKKARMKRRYPTN